MKDTGSDETKLFYTKSRLVHKTIPMHWGGLGVAWSDFTIQEPSGIQQKTIRDLEAGWTAGWAALGWPGLLLGWVAILGWLGLAWLANRNLKIW